MWHEYVQGREFFERLAQIDAAIVAAVAAGRCSVCGGPLHRGDYERKPRGGAVAEGGGVWSQRFSLCCGRRGCRRRATPPSVRFLGRRVYVGAAVIVGAMAAVALGRAAAIRQETSIPARTTRRWVHWWQLAFPLTAVFVELRGRLAAPVAIDALPESLLARFVGGASERLGAMLAAVAPLTTVSVEDGSRFVRAVV